MVELIKALPRNEEGNIIFSPAGEIDGELVGGEVSPAWLEDNFGELALSSVPLTQGNLEALKSIDPYWSANADKWREQGII